MNLSLLIRGLFVIMALALSLFTEPAHSQEDSVAASYVIGFGADDTSDFIGKTSFLGFSGETSFKIGPNDEGGFLIGYQRFSDNRSNSTYTDPSSGLTLTADQERSISSTPILAKWRHFFKMNENKLKWFAGAGAGGTYVSRRFFVGSFDFSEYGMQFLVRPEIGVAFEVAPPGAIVASLHYDYGVATGDLPTLGIFAIDIGYRATF